MNQVYPKDLEEILQALSGILFPQDLGQRPVEIDSVGVDGDTPLHKLVWSENSDGVQLLIHAGANINARGEMGETPLHVAVRQGHQEIIKDLIKAGADLDIQSDFGQTAREMMKKSINEKRK